MVDLHKAVNDTQLIVFIKITTYEIQPKPGSVVHSQTDTHSWIM